MKNLTKIGVVGLILGAFVVGGFALNALDVDAFGWGKNSEEWKAKMEEFKAMTPEEKQQYKEQCMEGEDCPYLRGPMGFGPLKMFGDEVNREVIILDNGIQTTITSDNPDVVQKLHDFAERINSLE